MYLLREWIKLKLLEYWQEPTTSKSDTSTTKSDRTMQPDVVAEEDPLKLDSPGKIVEPDVRKKLKKYFQDMGLSPKDSPGKTFK